ncbi:MAG: helix-hairpin-helix domain-containing protein [Breznakibacter sp.]
MFRRAIILGGSFLLGFASLAQEPVLPVDDVAQWMEELAEEGHDVDDDEHIDVLYRLAQSPVNLNKATRQTMSQFFFLSELQIESLMYYMYENGPLLTVYELQGVEGFDEKTIRWLLPFVVVEPVGQPSPVTGYTLVRGQMPVETARGYLPGGAYAGSKHKAFAKAEIDAGKWQLGVAAEKDAGEPVFSGQINGFDHHGGYLQWNPDKRNLATLVVGDFRLASGHGLALSTAMSMGRGAAPANIRVRNRTLHGYASGDEIRFFRGGAAKVNVGGHMAVTPFVSFKKVDGMFGNDSSGLASISLTGLHRTQTELGRRHNVGESMAGSLFSASFKRLFVEAGYFRYELEKPLLPSSQLYQIYDFTGRSIQTAWASYTQMMRKAVLGGEWAVMDFGRLAVSQSFTWEPDGKFALALRFQHFALGYWSPYMSPGARNANPSGETNVYAGFRLRHSRYVESAGYAFFYQNKWLRYLVDAPSEGFEGLWRTQHSVSKSFVQAVQMKWRHSLKNYSEGQTPSFGLQGVRQYNIRWNGDFSPAPVWRLVTRAEAAVYSPQHGRTSQGVMLNQNVAYRSVSGKWSLDFRYGIFRTDDYNSRIYVYEPDVRYAFSVPSWSGRGARTVFVARWAPHRNWDVYVRWANVKYADRTQTGSGYDLIDKPYRNEVKLQVIYSFWRKGTVPRGNEPDL